MPKQKRYCEVIGCSNPRFGHGFCNLHYKRWRKTGDPGPAEAREITLHCTVMGCDRKHTAKGLCSAHLAQFNRSGVIPTKPIRSILKPFKTDKCLRSYCELPGDHQGYCHRHNARQKAFISYGMTGWDEFDQLWEDCQGLCSICGIDLDIDSRKTHVDHCHNTIRARGLLCESCNNMLGNAKESVDILKSAMEYLERFKDHSDRAHKKW